MSRYTGPKARVNRRLGLAVFESAGAVKAMDRKPNPPGMHPPPRKLTEYALAMREKQKIKFYYGLHERQLRKLYDLASLGKGDTARTLLVLCERRIDNAISAPATRSDGVSASPRRKASPAPKNGAVEKYAPVRAVPSRRSARTNSTRLTP